MVLTLIDHAKNFDEEDDLGSDFHNDDDDDDIDDDDGDDDDDEDEGEGEEKGEDTPTRDGQDTELLYGKGAAPAPGSPQGTEVKSV